MCLKRNAVSEEAGCQAGFQLAENREERFLALDGDSCYPTMLMMEKQLSANGAFRRRTIRLLF
jgi:hypothetical protein